MAAAPTVIERLVEQVEERYRELEQQLADPDVISDRNRYAEVARSHRELGDAHELVKQYRMAESNAAGAQELLDEGEKEMQESWSPHAPRWRRSPSSCGWRWWSAIPSTTRT